jgi:[protein-PII] uridylyltransferase
LLAHIALILDKHNVRLHRAKINTLGSRAEDVFWISGEHLAEPEQHDALRKAILAV